MPITQTIRPRAWSRRLLRNGSRSIAGLLPRSGRGAFGAAGLIPVEGEDDVLEVGFATRHGDDFVACQHLDDGVQRAAHGEAECVSAGPGAGAGAHTPVSYTHLRAHETDSYLVCRLLLEK